MLQEQPSGDQTPPLVGQHQARALQRENCTLAREALDLAVGTSRPRQHGARPADASQGVFHHEHLINLSSAQDA